MSSMAEAARQEFGERAIVDYDERLLYSFDVGALPGVMEVFLETVPDVVVQPASKDEVRAAVGLARRYRMPIVPRGAATSGYGGVLPVRSGMVLDFCRMERIVGIDPAKMSATVEPGVVWWTLEKTLNKQGLSLKVYPSSAFSSTVGGSLAQGFLGIGSLEGGHSSDIIVSLEVVTPEGELSTLRTREEIDRVSECEGTTGIIVEATIRVKKQERYVAKGAVFKGPGELAKAVAQAAACGKLFAINFSNPAYLRVRCQVEDREPPPKGYFANFIFAESSVTKDLVQRAIDGNEGRQVPDAFAGHEWDERLFPMRIKKAGPTIITSEAVLPLSKLGGFLSRAERKVRDIQIEGWATGKDEGIVLSFMPADERKVLRYAVGWGEAMSLVNVALRMGGRIYAPGLYFANRSRSYFGPERYALIAKYKKKADPDNLFNPGKIFPVRASFSPMSISKMASMGSGVLGPFSKLCPYRPPKSVFGHKEGS